MRSPQTSLGRGRWLCEYYEGQRVPWSFGLNAGRAFVEYSVHVAEAGNTIHVLVCVEQVVVAGVAKTLVPKQAFGVGFDSTDGSILVNILVKRKVMETARNGS